MLYLHVICTQQLLGYADNVPLLCRYDAQTHRLGSLPLLSLLVHPLVLSECLWQGLIGDGETTGVPFCQILCKPDTRRDEVMRIRTPIVVREVNRNRLGQEPLEPAPDLCIAPPRPEVDVGDVEQERNVCQSLARLAEVIGT